MAITITHPQRDIVKLCRQVQVILERITNAAEDTSSDEYIWICDILEIISPAAKGKWFSKRELTKMAFYAEQASIAVRTIPFRNFKRIALSDKLQDLSAQAKRISERKVSLKSIPLQPNQFRIRD